VTLAAPVGRGGQRLTADAEATLALTVTGAQ